MTPRRRLAATAIVAALVLAACGSDDEGSDTSDNTDTKARQPKVAAATSTAPP